MQLKQRLHAVDGRGHSPCAAARAWGAISTHVVCDTAALSRHPWPRIFGREQSQKVFPRGHTANRSKERERCISFREHSTERSSKVHLWLGLTFALVIEQGYTILIRHRNSEAVRASSPFPDGRPLGVVACAGGGLRPDPVWVSAILFGKQSWRNICRGTLHHFERKGTSCRALQQHSSRIAGPRGEMSDSLAGGLVPLAPRAGSGTSSTLSGGLVPLGNKSRPMANFRRGSFDEERQDGGGSSAGRDAPKGHARLADESPGSESDPDKKVGQTRYIVCQQAYIRHACTVSSYLGPSCGKYRLQRSVSLHCHRYPGSA